MKLEVRLAPDVSLDPIKLIDSRMLVCANSGGGKSYLIRVICEQVAGKIPTIILDREGEFATLREKYDVVLIGEGGEADTSIATAAKLARTLVELGVSAVVNLYALSKADKRKFVRIFLETLLSLPRSLWRPMVVVVDEAHEFCPETGREAESREAVIRLMDSGRKRGICGILATQRISKLSKDAAAEANNICIGRTGLDVDMRRASDMLGFSGKSEWTTLRELAAGEWFAFGPAFAHDGVKRFRGAAAKTTHPKPGERHRLQSPAPSKAILKVAPELAALKQKVDEEKSELERLRAEVSELRRGRGKATDAEVAALRKEMAALQRQVLAGSHELVRKATEVQAAGIDGAREWAKQFVPKLTALESLFHDFMAEWRLAVRRVNHAKGAALRPSVKTTVEDHGSSPVRRAVAAADQAFPPPNGHRRAVATSQPTSLSEGKSGERRIMIVLAQRYPNAVERRTVGLLANMSTSSGTFATYLSRLRSRGWIDSRGSGLCATEQGMRELGPFDPLPSGAAAAQYWLDWCGAAGQRRMLEVLLEAGSSGISRGDLARESGMQASSGTFATYLSRLRSANIIEGKDRLKVAEVLL